MPNFEVSPGWYQAFWYGERPHREHGAFARRFARFAVVVVLLISSGVVLGHLHG
jgi:hypothetical protein